MNDCDRKLIKLQHPRFRQHFADFIYQLNLLVILIARSTTPGYFNSELLYVEDPYWGLTGSSADALEKAKELNLQASKGWDVFSLLLRDIHAEVPEAFDEEISYSWSYWVPE